MSFQYFGILHAVSNLSSAEVLVTKSILWLLTAYCDVHGIIATTTVSGSCPSLFPEDSKNAIHVTTVTQDGVRELKLIPRVSIDVRQWINI